MKKNTYYGTGKRKGAIAKVTLVNGTGKITVNGKDVHEYLPFETLVMDLSQPLEITNTKEIFDINVEVSGGGFRGQAADSENSLRKPLKVAGMITRDARIKERKKYGLKKARRAPQFSKR